MIQKEKITTILDEKYVKVYDLEYENGKHYLNASRRTLDELVAVKSDEEVKTMLPDAVSCFVIVKTPHDEPRLLLNYEYRYPAGQFLLSVPAGLIDPQDKNKENPLAATAIREIREETGLDIKSADKVYVVDSFVYSTPGMTDESNGLVCAVLNLDDLSQLSQDGAEGSECFDGFELVTKEKAKQLLKEGRDKAGNFYSVYTWASLMYFISDLWKDE